MSDWVEILWGSMKFFFKQMLKVPAFYLEKQKSLIPKKTFFKPLSISKRKRFVYWLNFRWRFWVVSGAFVAASQAVQLISTDCFLDFFVHISKRIRFLFFVLTFLILSWLFKDLFKNLFQSVLSFCLISSRNVLMIFIQIHHKKWKYVSA